MNFLLVVKISFQITGRASSTLTWLLSLGFADWFRQVLFIDEQYATGVVFTTCIKTDKVSTFTITGDSHDDSYSQCWVIDWFHKNKKLTFVGFGPACVLLK